MHLRIGQAATRIPASRPSGVYRQLNQQIKNIVQDYRTEIRFNTSKICRIPLIEPFACDVYILIEPFLHVMYIF